MSRINDYFIAAVEKLEQANNVTLLGRDVSKIDSPCPTCKGTGYRVENNFLVEICPTCKGHGSEA